MVLRFRLSTVVHHPLISVCELALILVVLPQGVASLGHFFLIRGHLLVVLCLAYEAPRADRSDCFVAIDGSFGLLCHPSLSQFNSINLYYPKLGNLLR